MYQRLKRWYSAYRQKATEKRHEQREGMRLWCPGCRGELTDESPPRRVRSGYVTDHYLCECGAISHWLMGAPVAILLGHTHWRRITQPTDPNWEKTVPIHATDGVLFHHAPSQTYFIYTSSGEMLVYPPKQSGRSSLPQRWRTITPHPVEAGYTFLPADEKQPSFLFDGHTFKEVSRTWVKFIGDKDAGAPRSNAD